MKDAKRVKEILTLIEKIWLKNPDLRLGQIMANVQAGDLFNEPFFTYEDIYFMEDDLVYKRLQILYDV